jgi:hypothetical protein
MTADLISFLIAAAPYLVAMAVVLFMAGVFASIAHATPGGMTPRTMDPAATWR